MRWGLKNILNEASRAGRSFNGLLIIRHVSQSRVVLRQNSQHMLAPPGYNAMTFIKFAPWLTIRRSRNISEHGCLQFIISQNKYKEKMEFSCAPYQPIHLYQLSLLVPAFRIDDRGDDCPWYTKPKG